MKEDRNQTLINGHVNVEGENFVGSYPRQKVTKGLLGLLQEGELASPRDEPPYWLSKAQRPVLKLYTINKIYTQHIVYTQVFLHNRYSKSKKGYQLESQGFMGVV